MSEATTGSAGAPTAPLSTGSARWSLAVRWCLVVALASAALEVAAFGLSTRLPLGLASAVHAVGAALTHLALYGVLGAVLGAVLAFLPARDPAVPVARTVGTTAFVASAVFFWTGAWTLRAEGSDLGATLFAAFPAVVLAFVYFTTRWLARRWAAGEGSPPGVVAGVGLLVVSTLLSGLAAELRQPTGLPAQRLNLVLVTVDGLSEGEQGPAFRTFASEGVSFRQAVTPTPGSTRAAHASMLVGLHPLRSGVLDDETPLRRGHRSVFEAFVADGWATGAFLSDTPLAAGCGLEQGFGTWDDGFVPAWRRPWLLAQTLGPSGHRTADETMTAFADWLGPRARRPFAVLIHLSDPVHVAQGAGPVDDAIGRLRTILDEARVLDHTVVVLVGAHGVSLSEPAWDLRDPQVHVPLAVRLPEPLQKPEVSAQVRVWDVANTLLDALRFRVMEESEGVALVAYGTGLRKATLSATLLGRDDQGRFFLGVRNNGVKFLVDADGAERMYDLESDPAERTDIAEDQPDTTRAARSIVNMERGALDRILTARGWGAR